MKKNTNGRIVIKSREEKIKRGNKTIVSLLKSKYTYGSPLDNERIERSLKRINRRRSK